MNDRELSSVSDELLLSRICNDDDRKAFAVLYDRYWEMLIHTCYKRLKCLATSEEIVQEIFVDLFVRRNELQLNSSLEAYLKTAVKYKIYNHYRSQQVHQSYLDRELNVQKILVPAPDEVFQKKELNALIMAATAQMPEKCKQVFLLSRYQHLSHKDISDQLGISVSTVKKHITKATNILKANFKHHSPDLLIILCVLLVL
ncbi:RNA polymerase sigma factor [Pedobacter helvus]|uniref:RNA polymerase sigma factor n=1 Tax=Pedobacter helvus TaxID=2563444 RepID=A0ABW9JNU2_9SPHI|nr:RNA polymerase sigma-70 factor [Pedobacter ureilyticus]